MNNNFVEGMIAAPFTPMHQDGTLNLSIIPAYYQMLKANGIKGAFICGSTGEGVSLTMDEKKQVASAWAALTKSDKDFRLILFIGGLCLSDSKELAIYSKEINVDAISLTAPFYFKPANVQMLAAACIEVASVVPDMPFYYYHIPVLTGVNFPMYDLLTLIDEAIPNFTGIKYTHEDFMDFLSCINFKQGKYEMMWGRDENMLSALALGTKGFVGSTFNYAAPLYHNLINAFNKGDLTAANHYQQQSIDMIKLLGKHGGIGVGKAYMKTIGLDCGDFRLPIKKMSAETYTLFKKDTDLIQFSTFSSTLA